ncbi:hypothetical protein [Halomonas sp.]|uniref:hypothetical protein n=1 Tax=Halomonas sp. TaxID=1486246 RepID=UPI0035617EBB
MTKTVLASAISDNRYHARWLWFRKINMKDRMRHFRKPAVLLASLSLMSPGFAQTTLSSATDTEIITLAQVTESVDKTEEELLAEQQAIDQAEADALAEQEASDKADAEALAQAEEDALAAVAALETQEATTTSEEVVTSDTTRTSTEEVKVAAASETDDDNNQIWKYLGQPQRVPWSAP